MTDRFLKPPARFSHGLVIGICVSLVLGLGSVIGQLPTILVGSATALLFIGGFWGLSRDAWLYTALGSLAVVVAGPGLVFTLVLAVLVAAQAESAFGLFLWSGVPLMLLGGAVSVIADLLPTEVMAQDQPALVALVYAAALTGVTFSVVSGVRLGVTTAFGTALVTTVGLSAELLAELISLNGVTRFGGLALLSGGCLRYSTRLARLSLVCRASRWLANRWRGVDAGAVPGRASPATATSDTESPPVSSASPDGPLLRDVLGIGPKWLRLVRVVGTGLLGLGIIALALGSAPDTRSTAARHPVGRFLGASLGDTLGPHLLLGSVAVSMGGLRLAHAVAWRAIHVDWSVHRRRLAYLSGGTVVLLAAALVARPLLTALLTTPAVQYVVVEPAGPPPPLIVLEHQPALFQRSLRRLVTLVGVSAFGIGLVAAVVLGSIVLVVAVGIGAAATRLTTPRAGIGLLFLGTAGGTVLGVPPSLAFVAGAVTLLAWDLHRLGAGLAEQLDPAATTLQGELAHLTVDLIVIVAIVAVTTIGAELTRVVPTPAARWQVFGALVCSFGAGILGLVVLGFRGDQ